MALVTASQIATDGDRSVLRLKRVK